MTHTDLNPVAARGQTGSHSSVVLWTSIGATAKAAKSHLVLLRQCGFLHHLLHSRHWWICCGAGWQTRGGGCWGDFSRCSPALARAAGLWRGDGACRCDWRGSGGPGGLAVAATKVAPFSTAPKGMRQWPLLKDAIFEKELTYKIDLRHANI